MSAYSLPKSAEVGGAEYAIRSDYRAALDIMEVMADPTVADEERALVALSIFYPDFDEMPPQHIQEALDYLMWFVGGGEKPRRKGKKPKLMDWRQDFQLIVGPVNKVVGCEVRDLEYMHWWTFLAAYREIGDCMFAQVVGIRSKKAKGQKLDKQDREFYRANRELVDFERPEMTEMERAALDDWIT